MSVLSTDFRRLIQTLAIIGSGMALTVFLAWLVWAMVWGYAWPVSLRAMQGRVVIVLHQDRYSSEQNQGFKDRLGELVLRHPQKLQLIALAEAGGYNFWPARRYVKDALRPLRELGGALVACDWKGAVQKNYRIPARQSAVFVVGKDGTLQALKKGVLGEAEAAALLIQIEKLALG